MTRLWRYRQPDKLAREHDRHIRNEEYAMNQVPGIKSFLEAYHRLIAPCELYVHDRLPYFLPFLSVTREDGMLVKGIYRLFALKIINRYVVMAFTILGHGHEHADIADFSYTLVFEHPGKVADIVIQIGHIMTRLRPRPYYLRKTFILCKGPSL